MTRTCLLGSCVLFVPSSRVGRLINWSVGQGITCCGLDKLKKTQLMNTSRRYLVNELICECYVIERVDLT